MKHTVYICLMAILALSASSCTSSTGNANSAQANENHNTAQVPMNGHMEGMDHGNMNMGNANMDHSMMMQSAPDAANQPYDLQFIDTMTQHHQGAVTMSQMAVQKAEHPELKQFAQKIIDDQQKEIGQMKEWRDKWFAGKPSALNMEMPGMAMGKMMDSSHTSEMQAMRGNDFDLHFLSMMVPHHEGAISMAKEALEKSEHPEIKNLAQQIIKAQQAEIDKMKGWQQSWKK